MSLVLDLKPTTYHTELPAPMLKRCTGCGADLPLEAYRVNKAVRLGRTARCRECLTAKDKAYNATPGRKAAERAREQRPDVKAKRRAQDAARMAEQCAKKSRRRAVIAGAKVGLFDDADMYAAWDDAGYYACYWCEGPFTEANPMHVDHVTPLAKGGAHALSNLVPACQHCNTSKGARDPYDFARELHPWLQ